MSSHETHLSPGHLSSPTSRDGQGPAFCTYRVSAPETRDSRVCLYVYLAPSLTDVTLCRWRCRLFVPCPVGRHHAVFGVCFHCLRVGLYWGTGRGDRGEAGAAVGTAVGSQEGPPLRQGRGSGAGRAVCGGTAAGGPAQTTGAQLPSEAGGQLPHLRHLPPGLLLCSPGAPLVALLSKDGQTSRGLCSGSSGVATAQNGGEGASTAACGSALTGPGNEPPSQRSCPR